jgi:hypothetical protein
MPVLIAVTIYTAFWSNGFSFGSANQVRRSFYPSEIAVLHRGDFIFFSSRVFSEDEMKSEYFNYIKRFRVCLTNGWKNFTGKELEELHAAGCELFLYRWFNGFYANHVDSEGKTEDPSATYARQFPEMVAMFREISSHPQWLLNPAKPIKGSGAVYPAYFFDYHHPGFRAYFADRIQRDLAEANYDGVFFDYIGGWALPEDVEALWAERHPDTSYNEAGLRFLKELRAVIGGKRIFGNQAYRLPEAYYDVIDYDATESHATSFTWGKEAEIYLEGRGVEKIRETFYRPWGGPGGYLEISKQRRKRAANHPRVRVFDINYLQPWYVPTGATTELDDQQVPVYAKRTDRPAIFYSYAIAKLIGGAVFASDWYAPGFGKDDVYFLDLGEPVDAGYVEHEKVVVRYYENGFIAVTRDSGGVQFEPDARHRPKNAAGLWDVYEGVRVWGWPRRNAVVIHPAHYPATDSYYPSGRVYMYLKSDAAS